MTAGMLAGCGGSSGKRLIHLPLPQAEKDKLTFGSRPLHLRAESDRRILERKDNY